MGVSCSIDKNIYLLVKNVKTQLLITSCGLSIVCRLVVFSIYFQKYIILWIILTYAVNDNYDLIFLFFFRVTELESLGYIGRSVNKQNIHAMVERLAYSDWLILYYLAQVSQQIGIKKSIDFFVRTLYTTMLHKNYSRSD